MQNYPRKSLKTMSVFERDRVDRVQPAKISRWHLKNFVDIAIGCKSQLFFEPIFRYPCVAASLSFLALPTRFGVEHSDDAETDGDGSARALSGISALG